MLVSDLYDDDAVQVKCPVLLKELLMFCNSESTCVGMTFKNRSSFKISQNVCTRLFLQIIYSDYLRSICPKHPYQYFLLRFKIVKRYILNLNSQLTLQSFFNLFSTCQVRIGGRS